MLLERCHYFRTTTELTAWIQDNVGSGSSMTLLPHHLAREWMTTKENLLGVVRANSKLFAPDCPAMVRIPDETTGQEDYLVALSETERRRSQTLDGRSLVFHVTDIDAAMDILRGGFYTMAGRLVFTSTVELAAALLPCSGDGVILAFELPNNDLNIASADLLGHASLDFSPENMGISLPTRLPKSLDQKISRQNRSATAAYPITLLFAETAGVLGFVKAERINREQTFSINTKLTKTHCIQNQTLVRLQELLRTDPA